MRHIGQRYSDRARWAFSLPVISPFSGDEADYRYDMARDADLLDDGVPAAPEKPFIDPAVQHHDCPTCGAVAGKPCRDWQLSPYTWNWYGSRNVLEGVHADRGRDVAA